MSGHDCVYVPFHFQCSHITFAFPPVIYLESHSRNRNHQQMFRRVYLEDPGRNWLKWAEAQSRIKHDGILEVKNAPGFKIAKLRAVDRVRPRRVRCFSSKLSLSKRVSHFILSNLLSSHSTVIGMACCSLHCTPYCLQKKKKKRKEKKKKQKNKKRIEKRA